MQAYKEYAERLLSGTKPTEAGCREWQGPQHRTGYGICCINGAKWLAHRFIYNYLVMPLPKGLRVQHLCGNRKCINPVHLCSSAVYGEQGVYNSKAHAELLLTQAVPTEAGCKELLNSIGNAYPRIWIPKSKSISAHRFIYEQLVDDIPEGLCVCHTCDNPKCINPAHLFLGTNTDNVHDKMHKRRWKGPIKVDTSMLTCIQSYREQGLSAGAIGAKLGVSHTTVLRYLRNAQGRYSVRQEVD